MTEKFFINIFICLATHNKLFVMNLVNSSVCNKCTTDSEQTPLHMLYQSEYLKPIFIWVFKCLFN